MDDADRAQASHDIELHSVIVSRQKPDAVPGEGPLTCSDCGDDIPAERRAAARGAKRCVFCQEAVERLRATHRTDAPDLPTRGLWRR